MLKLIDNYMAPRWPSQGQDAWHTSCKRLLRLLPGRRAVGKVIIYPAVPDANGEPDKGIPARGATIGDDMLWIDGTIVCREKTMPLKTGDKVTVTDESYSLWQLRPAGPLAKPVRNAIVGTKWRVVATGCSLPTTFSGEPNDTVCVSSSGTILFIQSQSLCLVEPEPKHGAYTCKTGYKVVIPKDVEVIEIEIEK